MKTQIADLGIYITKKIPVLKPILKSLNEGVFHHYFQKSYPIKFSGWGMTTQHANAWDDEFNCDIFRQSCIDLEQFEWTPSTLVSKKILKFMYWRHYIISFSVLYAIRSAQTKNYNFVECGVGDGASAFFSLNEITDKLKNNFTMHLYDAWQPMKKEYLLESESKTAGKYHDLSIERTKSNLKKFEKNIVYHQGNMPETFNGSPESIVYLHIDLNSAKPTLSALNFFYPKLVNGGIIIFDDYGQVGYSDTKDVVDKFFSDKQGILFKSPTSQAIYFHGFS